jgi:hypothetical protein
MSYTVKLTENGVTRTVASARRLDSARLLLGACMLELGLRLGRPIMVCGRKDRWRALIAESHPF